MKKDKQKKLLESLPTSPGVYLMKSAEGIILYVGKAKNLRSRVRSYFSSSGQDPRYIARNTRRLVEDIEVILTTSEKEALLLENNLIKEHTPRFNIKLRDDKNYISIRLDTRVRWPKLEIVRRPEKDGASYFGPYHSAAAARETLKVVKRSFKLRSCKDGYMKNRVRPCIQHQMHRCLAPCVYDVDRQEYMGEVDCVKLFLQGRREALINELKRRMENASAEMAYEKAAVYRDQIQAVNATLTPQRVVTPGGGDQDVVGIAREGDQVQLAIFEIRKGFLKGRLDFHYDGQESPDDEILSSFLMQRYDADRAVDEIIVSRALQDEAALGEVLTEKRKRRVRVTCPKRGDKAKLCAMADLNAEQLLQTRLKETDNVTRRLAAIERRLKLPVTPRRIECVDISHLGGTGTVGAISVVVDGQVRRDLLRTYKVKSATEGDDYAAMREVLERRFERARTGEPGWEAPDLLVVDGGRGQLSVARAVLSDLSMASQAVVALAKERTEKGDEWQDRVFLPMRKNPIPVSARLSALSLLALARDEAHRGAVGYQRKVRKKRTIVSELDRIPGIGPKTKTALLKQLGSVKRIREADLDTLSAVAGVGRELAKRIMEEMAVNREETSQPNPPPSTSP